MISDTKPVILADHDEIVFALKPAGYLSEENASEDNMVSYLSRELSCEIFAVHRLDRAVGGVMVFAKNKRTAAEFASRDFMEKEYFAVVHGETEDGGVLKDLLFKDSRANKSYVVKRMRRGVKEAALSYETLARRDGLSFVSVKLQTGRSHQIRVQFSSRRHPIVGDGKYGASDGCGIALFSRKILIPDLSGNGYGAAVDPDVKTYPWSLFGPEIVNCDK